MGNNSGDSNFKYLKVWQKAVDFGVRIIQLVDKLNTDRKHFRLIENLEAASQSNIRQYC